MLAHTPVRLCAIPYQVISLEKRLVPVRRHRMLHIFAVDGRLLPYDPKVTSAAACRATRDDDMAWLVVPYATVSMEP